MRGTTNYTLDRTELEEALSAARARDLLLKLYDHLDVFDWRARQSPRRTLGMALGDGSARVYAQKSGQA